MCLLPVGGKISDKALRTLCDTRLYVINRFVFRLFQVRIDMTRTVFRRRDILRRDDVTSCGPTGVKSAAGVRR